MSIISCTSPEQKVTRTNNKVEPIKIKGRIQIDEIKYSGPPTESWIVTGIRDTVTNDLAKIREVEAISIDDQNKALKMIAERRKVGEKNLDPSKESAKILAADYLCVGNLQNTGKVLRLNIRLLKAPDFSAEQSATIDGTLDEIFTLQDKVVESLLANVDAKMKPEERLVIEVFTPKNKKAYELYVQGLELRNTNPKKALDLFLQALQLEPDYLDALNRIGQQYEMLSKNDDALEYLFKRKKILEEKQLRIVHGYSITLNNIATVYYEEKNIEKAIEYLFDSLKVLEDIGLHKSASYSSTLSNIGFIFMDLEKYEEAFSYFSKALSIDEELRLKKTEAHAIHISHLGSLFRRQEKYEEALKYYSKSQNILEELGYSGTSTYANSLADIGGIYFHQDKLDEALKSYSKAQKIRETLEFTKTERYAITMFNIGGVYFEQDKYCEALKWREKAVKLQEQLKVTPEYKQLEITRNRCKEQKNK